MNPPTKIGEVKKMPHVIVKLWPGRAMVPSAKAGGQIEGGVIVTLDFKHHLASPGALEIGAGELLLLS